MLTTKNTIMSDNKVFPKEMTTVWGTGASKHMPAGKAYEVHKILAKTLIGKGDATDKEPTGEPAKKGGIK